MEGEERLRTVYLERPPRLLLELLAPDPALGRRDFDRVRGGGEAPDLALERAGLRLDRPELRDEGLVLLREHALLGLEPVPVGGDLARARIRALPLKGEPRAPLADLLPAGLGLLDAPRELGGELLQARPLPPERLDPLGRRRDLDPACRELAHRSRLLGLRPLDRGTEGRHHRLVAVLGLSGEGDARLEPLEEAVSLRALTRDLRELGLEGGPVAVQTLVLAVGLLHVLFAGEASRLARVDRLRERGQPLAEPGDLRLEHGGRRLRLGELPLEAGDVVAEVAPRAFAQEERGLRGLARLARPRAAPEPAHRREHLARRGHVGGHDAVSAPQALGVVEIVDDRDAAEQVVQQRRARRPDGARRPAHAILVVRDGARRRQGLDRDEGRRARALAREQRHRLAGVLEALDHDPLEPLAEHGLDRRVESDRHLQQVSHGADDSGQARGARLGEHRPHAGAVALPRTLELVERLEARPAPGQRDARFPEPCLRRGQPGLAVGQQRLDLPPLAQQGRERGAGPRVLALERGALGGKALDLGARRGQLLGELARAPLELRLPLAELPGGARQVSLLGGDAHLLEPESLEPVTLGGECCPALIESRLQFAAGARPRRGQRLGLAERRRRRRPLARDGDAPLLREPDLPGQPLLLLLQLADLDAHLLATLEQALDLALDLLNALAEVAETVRHVLLSRAPGGLARGQGGLAHTEVAPTIAQPVELGLEPRALRGERRVVRRDEGARERLLLAVQDLVLLSLLRLALEGAELASDLVHDVADPEQVLPRRVELALRLAALLLVAGDARRLLDEDPPLVRLRGQHVVELLLVHDRIGPGAGACPGQEVEDVAEAAGIAVEEVLALRGAIEPPAHGDLAPGHGQGAVV